MASMAFDIFARDHASRVFDKVGDNAQQLGRRIESAGGSMANLGAPIAALGVKAAATGAALATLGAAAASAAGYTVALAAAIAPVGGLLAGLPGLALTGAAAFATWKLATSGLGEAMGAALSGDIKALAKAMDQLSAGGQAFIHEFEQIIPELKSFKAAAQDAFTGQLAGSLAGFATALDGLKPHLAGLAGEFGSLVREALVFATAEKSVLQFNRILDNTGSLVFALRTSLQSLLTGLLDLAVVGSNWLRGFSGGLQGVLQDFGLWMSEISQNGKALEWLNEATAVLRQLGTLAKDVWQIFAGLLNAASAAGTNALGVLGSLVGGMNEWVNSAKGQETLVTIFKALNDIGQALLPVVSSLAGAIAAIAPEAAKVATALGPVLAGAIDALGPAIAALGPGLIAAIGSIGGAVSAVGPLLKPLGGEIGKIFAELGAALALIIPQVARIALALAPALAAAIRALGPALAALGPGLVAVAEMLAKAFASPEMQAGLLQLGKSLAGLLIAAAPLLPIAAQLAGILAQALGGALSNLGAALGPIIVALANALQPALRAVSDALNLLLPLMPPIYKAFGDIGAALIAQVLPPLLNLVPVMIGSLIPAFAELAKQMQPLIPLLADLAIKFINDILPALLPILPELTKMSLEFARLGIVLAQLVVTVAPIIERIIAAFQNLYDRLVGHSIIPDLINGIREWFQRGVDWVRSIIGWFANIPGMLGGWLGQALQAVQGKLNDVIGVFRDLPGRIVAGLGNLGGLLFNSGRSLIQGLIDGLYSMLQNAYNAAADILGQIRNLFPFSPAKEGPFAGKGWTLFSGQSMAEGLAKGLAGGEGLVARAAQGLMGAASLSLSPPVAPVGVGAVPLAPQGGGLVINLHFAAQPLVGRDEITRLVVAALNEAKGRGFNLGLT